MRRKIFLLTVLFSGLCVYANMPNTPRGRLNNFVVEQIRLLPKQTPASPAQWTKYQTVDFEKRNDGWIYLALNREFNGNVSRGDVKFFIDNDSPDCEMVLAPAKSVLEGMKYLKKVNTL